MGLQDFWIGLNDLDNEATFTWVSTVASTFTLWATNQPDDYKGKEDCVVAGASDWQDTRCGRRFPFVCEMGFHTNLVNFKGSDFYLGEEEVTQAEAQDLCTARGGNLVSFENEHEWAFVRGLQRKE